MVLEETLDDLRADPDARRAVIAAYARLERAFASAGLARRRHETAEEYVPRALAALEVDMQAVRTLTDLYTVAKFSHHPVSDEMKLEAVSALERIRDDLRDAAARAAEAVVGPELRPASEKPRDRRDSEAELAPKRPPPSLPAPGRSSLRPRLRRAPPAGANRTRDPHIRARRLRRRPPAAGRRASPLVPSATPLRPRERPPVRNGARPRDARPARDATPHSRSPAPSTSTTACARSCASSLTGSSGRGTTSPWTPQPERSRVTARRGRVGARPRRPPAPRRPARAGNAVPELARIVEALEDA